MAGKKKFKSELDRLLNKVCDTEAKMYKAMDKYNDAMRDLLSFSTKLLGMAYGKTTGDK